MLYVPNPYWARLASHHYQLTSLALDVPHVEPLAESDLLRHDSFHGSPHIAASTLEAQARIGTEMARLVIEYFETGKCNNSLNCPTITLDCASVPKRRRIN